jgi:hypothetical protein
MGMEGDLFVLSDSAQNRLPAPIRALPTEAQKVFILLRMRRDETAIARQTALPPRRVHELVGMVQNELAAAGTLDLIRDPVFYPLDHPRHDGDDDGPAFDIADGEGRDPADQLALDRFYRGLAAAVGRLPKSERRFLSLWFDKEMTAKEIVSFHRNIGQPVSDRKSIDKTKESDVFYELEKILKNLFLLVRTHLKEEGDHLTPSVVKAVLNETGIDNLR